LSAGLTVAEAVGKAASTPVRMKPMLPQVQEALGDLGVGEQALGGRGAVAVDEGGAFLLGEAVAHLLGDPLVDVDGRVIEQRRGGRRHRVQLHGRELHLGEGRERGRVGLGPIGGFRHPAGFGAGDGERLAVDRGRHLAHAGDGADRRDIFHRTIDSALDLDGDEIAAVGAGADRQGLGFEIADGAGVALADVGVERRLVLQVRACGRARGAGEMRAGGFQLQLVEGAVDAVGLLGGDDVGRHAPLELAEALVVDVLEGFEGAHEVVERAGDVVAAARVLGGFGFEGRGFGHAGSFAVAVEG
jgi:hypothetical protein